jgi:hypothetical protein
MSKNKVIALKRFEELALTPEEIQAEVDALYAELERRFGTGFADYIIGKYTDVKPKLRGE